MTSPLRTGWNAGFFCRQLSLLLALTSPVSVAWAQCFTTTSYGTGTYPTSVVIGDLNQDGNPDLATANYLSNNVSVLSGTGTGSFGTATTISVGINPRSVAIGDLNQDGIPDLATANYATDNVSTLLGSSFGTRTDFSVGSGSGPFSVAIGDVNKDGKSDLVVANYSASTVSVLLGSGAGSFGAATSFSVGTNPQSVAIGDFNNDGNPDLTTANFNSNNVSVLLGTGTGSFGAATNFTVGTKPISVAIGDLNKDGKLDLAVANQFSNNVSVLLGNGAGNFGAATNFSVGTSPRSVAIGDLNNDGKPDLATANFSDNNVSVLSGDGTGSFGTRTNFSVGTGPFSVATGDLNGDGKTDLVAANSNSYTVSVLLNCANAGGPQITTSSATGTITACQGTASVSPAVQNFTVSGTNLTSNVIARAPTNFEISTNALTSYTTSLTLTQSGGTLATTTIYVRSAASAPAGLLTGNVSLTSAGASDQLVPVNSNVTALPVATLTNNGPLSCTLSTVTLTAGGGASYSFSAGATQIGNTNQATVSVAGVYSVTVANSAGCTAVASTSVTSATATVVVSNPASTTAALNAPFSQTFTASGGQAPYSFSLASGTLPAGLSLATTGVLSGTPTQTGSFSMTVRATDANGCSGVGATYTLTVNGNATPTITGFGASPNPVCAGSPVTFTATIGNITTSYSYTLSNGTSPLTGSSSNPAFSQGVTASGSGVQTYTLTVSSGGAVTTATTSLTVNALPLATLSNNGPLSCTLSTVTLTASGGSSYSFSAGATQLGTSNQATVSVAGVYSVTVANSGGCTAVASTSVTSATATVVVSNPASTTAALNAPFSQTFTASGGQAPYSFSLASGTLPAGLSLATTGVLSGTPTQTGSFSMTVRATDTNGCSGVGATYTLTVRDVTPTITGLAASPNPVCSGSPVTFTATIGNITTSYNYTLSNGVTPTTGSSSNPAFSQSLTASGSGVQTYTLTVSSGGAVTTATTSLTVNALPLATLSNNGPLSCTLSTVTLTAGGGASYSFSAGATQIGNTNQATVSVAGVYSVTVANSAGCTAVASTSVTSATATVVVSNPASTTAALNSPFSQTFMASGGQAPYSFSLASGTLPAGLSLATTGVLSGTPTQTGSFSMTVRATDTNGCSGVGATYTLTVRDVTPTITGLAASPNPVCSGSPVTFTATIGNISGSYSYTLSNGTGPLTGSSSSPAFSQSLTASGSGVQTYTLTVSSGGAVTTATTSLTVNALPSATLTNNGPLSCTLSTVTLTASGGSSYSFSAGATQLGTSNQATVSVAGVYSVTVANASGCTAVASTSVTSATANVSVSNPTSTTAALNSPFSQTFTASGGQAPYSFSLASGTLPAGLSLATTGVLSGTPTETGSFSMTVRATDTNGCSGVGATYTLTVRDVTPTITGLAASPNPVCAGSPVTFTATIGNITTSYSYTLSNGTSPTTGSSSSPAFSQGVTASGSGVQTYTLTVSSGGAVTTATTSLTVNALPSATLTNNGPLSCTLSTVTLTASGGSSYSFSAGVTQLGTSNQATVTTAGVYSVTVANSAGCTAVASTSVTSATANVSVSNPTSTTAALNSPFSQTFTASGGQAPYSFSLASGSLPAGLSLSTSGVLSGTPTQTGSFSITVQATDANGCSGVGATYTLTVRDVTPTITGLAASPNPVCSGSPVTFTATIGNITTSYNYTLSNGTGPLTGSSSSPAFSQGVTASGSGVQTYTLTVSSGGSTATATTSLTVNALPVATLTNNGPLSCTLSTVTLTASGGTSYSFSAGATQLGTSNQATVSVAGVYSVTVANSGGCTAVASTSVTSATATVVVSNPASTTAALNSPFSQTFTASGGQAPYSYSLASGSLPAGLNLSTSGVLSGTPTETGSFSITVQATDANGCSGVGSVYILTVSANTTPTITGLAASPNPVCAGSPVTFTATIGNITTSYSYTLSNGTGPITGSSSNVAFSQSLTASGSGVQTYTLTVSSGGATATSTTSLTVNETPAVPTLTTSSTSSCGSPLSVTATCPTGSVNWQASGGVANGNVYTVSQPGTYTITAICVSPASCGSPAASPVVLQVQQSFTITQAPVSQTACVGGTVTFSVRATPSTGVTYAWYKGTTTSSVLATTPDYTVSVTDGGTAGKYIVQIKGGACNQSEQRDATLTVNQRPVPPTLTSAKRQLCPSASAVDLGQFVSRTSTSYTLRYFDGNGKLLPSPSVVLNQPGNYPYTATQFYPSTGCESTPTAFTLTVNPTTQITTNPANQTVCSGSNAVLTVVANGSNLKYEWFKNSISNTNKLFDNSSMQTGTTTASLTLVKVSANGTYYVRVTGDCGTASSSAIQVTVRSCGARAGAGPRSAEEVETPLSVRVLGNPVGETLTVEISGAEGQPVNLLLSNEQGWSMSQHQVERAGAVETVELSVGSQSAGLLLLRVSTPTQSQTVKVLKR